MCMQEVADLYTKLLNSSPLYICTLKLYIDILVFHRYINNFFEYIKIRNTLGNMLVQKFKRKKKK